MLWASLGGAKFEEKPSIQDMLRTVGLILIVTNSRILRYKEKHVEVLVAKCCGVYNFKCLGAKAYVYVERCGKSLNCGI